MENIFPLILIVIVFNVINAILKAFRGAKGADQKVLPPAYAQPGQKVAIDPWGDDSLDESSREPVYETIEAETESYATPMPVPPPLPEAVYRRPPAQKVESARGTRSTADGSIGYDGASQPVSPAKVLASGNAFLNAYIFYEILQPPVSMRKKR
jgi:hypothetical protein